MTLGNDIYFQRNRSYENLSSYIDSSFRAICSIIERYRLTLDSNVIAFRYAVNWTVYCILTFNLTLQRSIHSISERRFWMVAFNYSTYRTKWTISGLKLFWDEHWAGTKAKTAFWSISVRYSIPHSSVSVLFQLEA